MPQTSGFRNKRVAICNRAEDGGGEFGRNSAGRPYRYECTVWASVRFVKGQKAMEAGAMEAYDTLLIGMLWNSKIGRESALVYDGRTWQIQSFNRDFQTNEIQITAREWAGKDFSGLVQNS